MCITKCIILKMADFAHVHRNLLMVFCLLILARSEMTFYVGPTHSCCHLEIRLELTDSTYWYSSPSLNKNTYSRASARPNVGDCNGYNRQWICHLVIFCRYIAALTSQSRATSSIRIRHSCLLIQGGLEKLNPLSAQLFPTPMYISLTLLSIHILHL